MFSKEARFVRFRIDWISVLSLPAQGYSCPRQLWHSALGCTPYLATLVLALSRLQCSNALVLTTWLSRHSSAPMLGRSDTQHLQKLVSTVRPHRQRRLGAAERQAPNPGVNEHSGGQAPWPSTEERRRAVSLGTCNVDAATYLDPLLDLFTSKPQNLCG